MTVPDRRVDMASIRCVR